MMQQRPAKTSDKTRRVPSRILTTSLAVAAPAAFAGEDGVAAVSGETGLWFIALMAVFVAVIVAGFWLHARDERLSPRPEREALPHKADPAHRSAAWRQRQGESR